MYIEATVSLGGIRINRIFKINLSYFYQSGFQTQTGTPACPQCFSVRKVYSMKDKQGPYNRLMLHYKLFKNCANQKLLNIYLADAGNWTCVSLYLRCSPLHFIASSNAYFLQTSCQLCWSPCSLLLTCRVCLGNLGFTKVPLFSWKYIVQTV